MDLQLKGKRALVTGSSSGIGAGIAQMLAAEGCDVIIHGRHAERAQAVSDRIGAVAVALGDLSTDAGADAAAAAGHVDILVNNAGGADSGSSARDWLDVAEDEWGQTYQQNVVAAARLIRRFAPAMKAQGWGRVIQIASAAATQPIPFGPDYGAAKGAMVNMTVSLAKSLAGTGITVNAVSPGAIRTPAVEAWAFQMRDTMGWDARTFEEIEPILAREIVQVPAGRIGRVEDIGHAVCMIASPHAGFMTGANVRVDGGQNQAVN